MDVWNAEPSAQRERGGETVGFLFRVLGLAAGGILGAIVMATVGAVVLVYVVRVLKKA